MQEKKNDFRTFLERSDALAQRLRVSLRELAPILGMSVASLFGYRSGDIKISMKAWGKLEAAEKNAVLRGEKESHVEASDSQNIKEQILLLRIEMARLTEIVESLVEKTNKAPIISYRDRGKKI